MQDGCCPIFTVTESLACSELEGSVVCSANIYLMKMVHEISHLLRSILTVLFNKIQIFCCTSIDNNGKENIVIPYCIDFSSPLLDR